ncbi:MAG: AsmA family protein [Lentisphaeria bacterium]|jgi:hypothetical protein
MKRLWKIALALLILLAVGLLLLYAALGMIVKKGITGIGPALTGCPITLEDVQVSPHRGHFELTNLVVGNPEGFKTPRAFALGKVRIEVAPGSLFKDTIHVRELLIEAPEITYELGLAGSNLGAIQKNVEKVAGGAKPAEKPAAPAPAKPGKKVIIDKVSINGGKIILGTSLLATGAPIPLPNLQLTDIGKAQQGTSIAEAVKEILAAIIRSVTDVAKGAAGEIGAATQGMGDAARQAGESLKDSASGIIKGVKGIFGGGTQDTGGN